MRHIKSKDDIRALKAANRERTEKGKVIFFSGVVLFGIMFIAVYIISLIILAFR